MMITKTIAHAIIELKKDSEMLYKAEILAYINYSINCPGEIKTN